MTLLKPLLLNVCAHIPVLNGTIVNRGTGGTNRALYCYGIWLKHVSFLHAHMPKPFLIPNTLAELGPGDSIGVGIAALLSGANHYYGLDIKRYSSLDRNLKILDELADLFKRKAPRPVKGFPDFDALLDENLFPNAILTDRVLSNALHPARIAAIKQAIINGVSDDGTISIQYIVPWNDEKNIEPQSVDVIVSHSVLEHVNDLESAYTACHGWLKPNGIMTHQIDFTSHGLAKLWNGYRTYSERVWKMLSSKRDCWINRQPVSVHQHIIENLGFDSLIVLKQYKNNNLSMNHLAPRWRSLSEDDLSCSGVFLQARKSSK
jgi:hypothetical protein